MLPVPVVQVLKASNIMMKGKRANLLQNTQKEIRKLKWLFQEKRQLILGINSGIP
jgi:hypothetical protein